MSSKSPTFQEIIFALHRYWREQGCVSWNPHHEVVGAGTGNPATLLRVLGPEPWNVAYVEPSFRPDDGRYGENPNRLQMHHQFQVILQPIPENVQQLYLDSLFELGIQRDEHDLRFVEDNWESPALGAWGLGWEVWLDGMEISQYTYFQQAGGLVLDPPACELTYGLERIAMSLQNVDSVYDLRWDDRLTYGEILKKQEIEFCVYDFEVADVARLEKMYELFEEEARACLERGLVAPAYDYVLRCSHTFNLLDSRGAVSVSQRAAFFGRMRDLTRLCSRAFAEQREEMEHPLLRHMPKRVAPTPAPAAPAPENKGSFLFELGVEELPASEVSRLLRQLETGVRKQLAEHRLEHGAIKSFGTPRRLALFIEELAPRQEDLSEELRGPSRAVCEKNPKALQGFLRKAGLGEDAIEWKEIKGQEYPTVLAKTEGRPSPEVLAEVLPKALRSLTAGRGMRWLASAQVGDEHKIEFSRPIRWLVALLDEQVVPFHYAGLESGRSSVGGRFDGSPVLEFAAASEYEAKLIEQGIHPDIEERKGLIATQVGNCAEGAGAKADLNPSLLDQVNQLVECPTAFVGTFSEEFLELPDAVLVAVMEKHQRYFPLRNEAGELVPAFIGVRNGRGHHIDSVRSGNEKVIRARLDDATFFFRKDRETPFAEFRPNLETLSFHEKLGSMLDKSERLRRLARQLGSEGLLPADVGAESLDRAAELAKNDLVTQMVTEMTSLQGIMGNHYAQLSGESAAVALALEEHYLPRQQGDRVPSSSLGLALGICDRLDSLVAFFAAGVKPSGTGDPFGLRRDAAGLLAGLRAFEMPFSLDRALAAAADGLPLDVDDETVESVKEYITRRLENQLRDEGYPADGVRAVLSRLSDDPAAAARAVKELEGVRELDSYKETLEAVSRCNRLYSQAVEKGAIEEGATLDPSIMATEEEKALAAALNDRHGAEASGPQQLFEALTALAPTISAFFEAVMVMDPDPAQRTNRLVLLREVNGIIDDTLDIRQLEGA